MSSLVPVNTGTTIPADTNAQVNDASSGSAPPPASPLADDGFQGPNAHAEAKAEKLPTVAPKSLKDLVSGHGQIGASNSANAEATAVTVKGSTGPKDLGSLGTVTASGQVQLLHAQASESASFKASAADMSIDGSVKLHVDASLIKAGGSIEGDIPVKVGQEQMHVHYNLSAQGAVGLTGDVNLSLHLSPTGVRVAAQASGNIANASASLRVEVDDDQKRELAGGQVSLGVAAGVGIGAQAGGGVTRTTGNMTADQKAVKNQWSGGGTKSWGLDFNGSFALGPASGSYSMEVNPITIARDIPKMISP
jgi:hypothetical protein